MNLGGSIVPSVPAELFTKLQVSVFSDPVNAVFKALGVDRPLLDLFGRRPGRDPNLGKVVLYH